MKTKKQEFKYINNIDPLKSEATILLYDVIGNLTDENGNTVFGIQGKDFANELMFLDCQKVEDIYVRICSTGGNVIDGYQIISAIGNCKAQVTTINDGLAASIAGLILVSGDVRKARDYSITMIHNPSSDSENGDDKRALSKIKESIVTILTENSILSQKELDGLMDEETYYNAEEALTAGLIDSIIPTGEKIEVENNTVGEMITVFNNLLSNEKIMRKTAKKEVVEIVDKAKIDEPKEATQPGVESPTTITNDDDTTEDKAEVAPDPTTESPAEEKEEEKITPGIHAEVRKRLGLDEKSSDEDCMDALKKHFDEMDKMKSDYKDCQDKLETLAAEATKAHKEKIHHMLNSFVTAGKIENSDIATYSKLAETDFEATKSILDKIGGKAISISNFIKGEVVKTVDGREKWTIRDYEKNAPKDLLKISQENPTLYAKMYDEFYKKAK